MQSRVDRQLRALALAKACAACGARVRTIGHLTGLPPREALRLLFPDRMAVPRGRSPDSPEWYHGANLLHRAEASIVVALYRRLRDADFPAGEALVGAYRHYVGICQPPHRISFDRAFDLAAHTDGLWLTDSRSFSLVTCPTCHSEFLAAYGSVARSNDHCPFCKLVQRYGTDPRVQGAFPVQPLAAPSAEQLGMLVLLQRSFGSSTGQAGTSSTSESQT
ncbi:MAG: FlhC family transcriptional regulator [Piscinibacter sp.]|uniref:FlhC family transcriptional regulator n=1 Tax=Piscinibacter sp. TaxID=1903157 RepID=UPI003D0C572D